MITTMIKKMPGIFLSKLGLRNETDNTNGEELPIVVSNIVQYGRKNDTDGAVCCLCGKIMSLPKRGKLTISINNHLKCCLRKNHPSAIAGKKRKLRNNKYISSSVSKYFKSMSSSLISSKSSAERLDTCSTSSKSSNSTDNDDQ